jgi:hypothetical protein
MGRPYQLIQTKCFSVVLAVYLALQVADQPCDAEISTDSDECTQIVASCSEAVVLVVDKDAAEQVKLAADQVKFQSLVAQWRAERKTTSSWTDDIVNCPSYHKIMGMGDAAVPLILAELKNEGDEPDHWFWALHVITGENPVAEADAGNILKMANAWLIWGSKLEYVA